MSRGARVSGGAFGGLRILVPAGVRPVEGRVREALFSRWSDALTEARFLDLFAGSGVVSVEALGRGAGLCTLVERHRGAGWRLRKTLTGLSGIEPTQWRLFVGEAVSTVDRLSREGEVFDRVFADPPYDFDNYAAVLRTVEGVLAPGGELAIEHSDRRTLEVPSACGLVEVDRRRYGDSSLTFYRAFEGFG